MPEQMKKCPYCAEKIQAEANKCRYCGSVLTDKTFSETYLLPGMRLGDYEIVRKIGEGGMGVVYETNYFGLGENVKRAIKTVPNVISKDARSLKSLQKEVQIACNLSHPNIVRVYGLEQYQEIHFITMEYIEGYDFREYLDEKGGKIDVKNVVEILKGVANALDYAHGLEKPIIHRDLKPQNLIYDKHSKQLKIVDFGIAAEITDSVTTLTQTKLGTSGSPRYMCYEQSMGEKPAVHMDTYAFGIIIYEALNGEPPFVRGDLLAQHKGKEISDVSETKHAIMLVLIKALSKIPGDRYEKHGEMLIDLTTNNNESVRKSESINQESSDKPEIVNKEPNVGKKEKKYYEEVEDEKEQKEKSTHFSTIVIVIILMIISAGIITGIVNNVKDKEDSIKINKLNDDDLNNTNADKSFQLYKRYAEEGIARYQYKLAGLYYEGTNVTQNKSEAFKWMLKAAEQGYADAQFALGTFYDKGDIVPTNKYTAYEWYRKAAEQGYANAQNSLGVCYYNGEGVTKDKTEAVKWFRKAAEQGLAEAQNYLGICYNRGEGVTEDDTEAVKWFRKAAEQNCAEAQNYLAVAYYYGFGVAEDEAEAMLWFQKAADQGLELAQENLNKEIIFNMLDMVRIETTKTFIMGSDQYEQSKSVENVDFIIEGWMKEELPKHQVILGTYQISKCEITQKIFYKVMGYNRSYYKGDDLPVTDVSWYDAIEFCNKLSEIFDVEKVYTINGSDIFQDIHADGFRLPTEAEWEYAAKGGNRSIGYFYSGSNNLADVGWYNENSNSTIHGIGEKKCNEIGLYDMSGNVWEWCWDRFGSYNGKIQTNPTGNKSGNERVLRGGSCMNKSPFSRTVARFSSQPEYSDINIGFRVVCR